MANWVPVTLLSSLIVVLFTAGCSFTGSTNQNETIPTAAQQLVQGPWQQCIKEPSPQDCIESSASKYGYTVTSQADVARWPTKENEVLEFDSSTANNSFDVRIAIHLVQIQQKGSPTSTPPTNLYYASAYAQSPACIDSLSPDAISVSITPPGSNPQTFQVSHQKTAYSPIAVVPFPSKQQKIQASATFNYDHHSMTIPTSIGSLNIGSLLTVDTSVTKSVPPGPPIVCAG